MKTVIPFYFDGVEKKTISNLIVAAIIVEIDDVKKIIIADNVFSLNGVAVHLWLLLGLLLAKLGR